MKKVNKISKGYLKKEILENLFFGFVGFFLFAFLIQISSNGSHEQFKFNLINAVEFLSVQSSYILNLPREISLFLGAILLIIPGVFFYFLSKEFRRFNFKSRKKK